MRNKILPTQKFETLIGQIVDHKISRDSLPEIIKIADDVIHCKAKMFWLVCLAMGLKEGSTYAQGARKLKKDLGV